MKLREEFVLKMLAPGTNVAALAREYDVSRKTAYKWCERFRTGGVEALNDLSRRPHISPVRASGEAVLRVLELRRAHPRWGAKKLRHVLLRTARTEIEKGEVPSVRTVARILARAGEVVSRRPRSATDVPREPPHVVAQAPNEVWTVDFKGWWRTGDGSRAEPLTVRDAFSRFVLSLQIMSETSTEHVRPVFERLFEQHGLPVAIQMDNGSPFACTRARGGLTTLSAWWVSLGIRLIRGRPAKPQDNGGHERMHLDVSREVEAVAAATIELQQVACDRWRHEFNHVRPHEALDMKTPADIYRKSSRRYTGPRLFLYPDDCYTRKVDSGGHIKWRGKAVRVSEALRGQQIGVFPLDEARLGIRFYELDLGEIHLAA